MEVNNESLLDSTIEGQHTGKIYDNVNGGSNGLYSNTKFSISGTNDHQPMEMIEGNDNVRSTVETIHLSSEKPQRKLQQHSQQKIKKNKETVENKFREPQINDLKLIDQPTSPPSKNDTTSRCRTDDVIETEDSVESVPILDLDRLVSKHIEIYWDGDRIFYPCTILRRISESPTDLNDTTFAEYVVLYENDDSQEEYTERLSLSVLLRRQSPRFAGSISNPVSSFVPPQSISADSASIWRLWDGDDDDYATFLQQQTKLGSRGQAVASKMTYSAMVIEAVATLATLSDKDAKNGSSLVAIRKQILATYGSNLNKQAASFNSLSLKGINKALAAGDLEKSTKQKGHYRLSESLRDKRNLPAIEKDSQQKGSNNQLFDSHGQFSFVGTAAANNKSLRNELLAALRRRDNFLSQKLCLMTPFLPENNYFDRHGITDTTDKSRVDNIVKAECGNRPVVVEVEEDIETLPPERLLSGGEKIFESLSMSGVEIVSQPPTLLAELHTHQVHGISWMVHMFQKGMPMILGDQMGLGKTLQSIGFIAYLHHALSKRGPHLVIVPLSVLSNWLIEIERFCPSLRAVRFHGPKGERNRIKAEEINDLSEFDIVVTTYEILVSEVNFFRRRYVWTTIIVDEGHRLKNEKSQLSEKLRIIPCLCKVILTGTPLQNNLKELWAMLFYLAPDIFTSSKPFEEGFDLLRGVINAGVLRKARKLLSIFMLRRVKDQVDVQLPNRKELTILVPLTDMQKAMYKQLLCGLGDDVIEMVMCSKGTEGGNEGGVGSTPDINGITSSSNVANYETTAVVAAPIAATATTTTGSSNDSEWRLLMNLLLQLRKVCNHTYLMPDAAPEPYEITEDIVGGSGKLMMLDRILPRLQQDGHRVLLFSQFTSMLDILEDYCELRDYQFVRLDGSTNRVKRRLDVRRFNSANSSLFIFLISTRAGGLGLNLASADTVILYDSDWNPQVDLQAMERSHRIGQTKPVRVYRLVCSGSVEERMISRAEKKLFLNAMVAEVDPDEELVEDDAAGTNMAAALGIGGTAMSKGELASLIRFGANAVYDGREDVENNQISDLELDKLLERPGGRDTTLFGKCPSKKPLQIDDGSSASAGNDKLESLPSDDPIEKAQQALRERMEFMKEVDLRQLGDILYQKKPSIKGTGESSGDLTRLSSDFLSPLGKRVRKERIVMVNGKGSGYGGAVPILSDSMDSAINDSEVNNEEDATNTRRRRQWHHISYCVLCGRKKSPSQLALEEEEKRKAKRKKARYGKKRVSAVEAVVPIVEFPDPSMAVKCAHCPWVVHLDCAAALSLPTRSSGGRSGVGGPSMFGCPHHKCCSCYRSTAAAGGMLFRCTGCLTAYCEDCLPQDEVESIGRCRELETLGYDSKQCYFIRCPSCLLFDNEKNPTAGVTEEQEQEQVEGDEGEDDPAEKTADGITGPAESDAEDGAKEDKDGDCDPEEAFVPSKTQLMRIFWTEVSDEIDVIKESETDDEVDNSGSAKKSGKKRKKSDEEEEVTDEVEEWESIAAYDPDVPDEITPADCVTLISKHPAFQRLLILAEWKPSVAAADVEHDPDSIAAVEAHNIFNYAIHKLESGRYRGPANYFTDLKNCIDSQLVRSVQSKYKAMGKKCITLLKSWIDQALVKSLRW